MTHWYCSRSRNHVNTCEGRHLSQRRSGAQVRSGKPGPVRFLLVLPGFRDDAWISGISASRIAGRFVASICRPLRMAIRLARPPDQLSASVSSAWSAHRCIRQRRGCVRVPSLTAVSSASKQIGTQIQGAMKRQRSGRPRSRPRARARDPRRQRLASRFSAASLAPTTTPPARSSAAIRIVGGRARPRRRHSGNCHLEGGASRGTGMGASAARRHQRLGRS